MSNLARAIVLCVSLLACAALAHPASPGQDERTPSASPPAPQPGERALTNADVLALLDAGLPESVLVAKIATAADVRFDTSAETLVALSQGGVPAAVLTAMVRRDSPVSSLTKSLGRNFQDTPCETPGMFLERDDGLHTLEVVGPARHSSGGAIAEAANMAVFRRFYLPGVFASKTKVTLRGAAASFRIAESKPTFLLCLAEYSQDALVGALGHIPIVSSSRILPAVHPAAMQLVAFRVRKRKDEREFNIAKERLFGVTEAGVPAKQLRDVVFAEVKRGVYRLHAKQPLKPGEYGFYDSGATTAFAAGGFGGRLYAFGVDKK